MDALGDPISVARRKAQALYQQGRLAESLKVHEEALRLAPDSVIIHLSAAKIAHAMELQSVSLAHFEAAARSDPRCYPAIEAARRICVGAGLAERGMHFSMLARALHPTADAWLSEKLIVPSILASREAMHAARRRYEQGLDEAADGQDPHRIHLAVLRVALDLFDIGRAH